MRIEMEQKGQRKLLVCRTCGSEDLSPIGRETVPAVGATFLSLQAQCDEGHPVVFRWTNGVTLRAVDDAEK